jgi:hypothetical protein
MLTSGVVLIHDNARLRTVACTLALLMHFNWELFDHCYYSPDLVFRDYLPEELGGITALQQ